MQFEEGGSSEESSEDEANDAEASAWLAPSEKPSKASQPSTLGQTLQIKAVNSELAGRQASLVKEAFAGVDAEADFEEMKELERKEDESSEHEVDLPGWVHSLTSQTGSLGRARRA